MLIAASAPLTCCARNRRHFPADLQEAILEHLHAAHKRVGEKLLVTVSQPTSCDNDRRDSGSNNGTSTIEGGEAGGRANSLPTGPLSLALLCYFTA